MNLNANEEYMRVRDVQEYLGISRGKAYNLCSGEYFKVIRIGRLKLIRKSDLEGYLANCGI